MDVTITANTTVRVPGKEGGIREIGPGRHSLRSSLNLYIVSWFFTSFSLTSEVFSCVGSSLCDTRRSARTSGDRLIISQEMTFGARGCLLAHPNGGKIGTF